MDQKNCWSPENINLLEKHFTYYSYIKGYQPTVSDVIISQSLRDHRGDFSPYLHLTRWLNHIKTYESEKLGGETTSVEEILGSLGSPWEKVGGYRKLELFVHDHFLFLV